MERNVGTSDRFVLFVGKNLPRHTNLNAKMGNKKSISTERVSTANSRKMQSRPRIGHINLRCLIVERNFLISLDLADTLQFLDLRVSTKPHVTNWRALYSKKWPINLPLPTLMKTKKSRSNLRRS